MAGENTNNQPAQQPKKLKWGQRLVKSLHKGLEGIGKVVGFFVPKGVKKYLKRLVTILGFRKESEKTQEEIMALLHKNTHTPPGEFPPPPNTPEEFKERAGQAAEREEAAKKRAFIEEKHSAISENAPKTSISKIEAKPVHAAIESTKVEEDPQSKAKRKQNVTEAFKRQREEVERENKLHEEARKTKAATEAANEDAEKAIEKGKEANSPKGQAAANERNNTMSASHTEQASVQPKAHGQTEHTSAHL